MHSIQEIIIGLIQVLVILSLAPLLTGIIRKTKARTQKRIGASVLQPYYDILKMIQKNEVVSEQSSWVFRACPWVNFVAMGTAAFFIPVFLVYTPFGLVGDLILVIGLFALARFFTMLAGLDVASSFGGLGSSREMMISALLEPALFLSIFVVAITYGGTNLSTLISASSNSSFLPHPQIIFAAIGMFIIILGETGRLPFDNPATHLELTMVHEAMILEYSGKSLAFDGMVAVNKTNHTFHTNGKHLCSVGNFVIYFIANTCGRISAVCWKNFLVWNSCCFSRIICCKVAAI